MLRECCPACAHEWSVRTACETLMRCPGCRVEYFPAAGQFLNLSRTDPNPQPLPKGAPEAPATGTLKISDVFRSRYRLGRLLGRGVMGMVFLAQDLASGDPVAVKFMIDPAEGVYLSRFMREAALLTSVSHPHVLRLRDMDVMEAHPYLVTEYLSGGTLRARMPREVALDPAQAVGVVCQILRGLEACHAKGVVHRDVKPENILFDDGGRAKVADLGIARLIGADSSLTNVGSLLGTPRYMAPEVARGLMAVPATDLYAAGVMLYEMLAGVPPFRAGTMSHLLKEHIEAPVPPLRDRAPQVTDDLWSLVQKALSKDPQDRPSSAAAMAETLGRLVPGSDPGWAGQSLGPTKGGPTPGAARRHRPPPAGPQRTPMSQAAPETQGKRSTRVVGIGVCVLLLGVVAGAWVLRPIQLESTTSALPEDPRFAQGLALASAGKAVEAEEAFLEALVRSPESPRILAHLALAMHAQNRTTDARRYLVRALAVDPDFALAVQEMGCISLATSDVNGALEAYQKALALEPGNAVSHAGLARALNLKGRLAEAESHFKQARALDPRSAKAHEFYAVFLHEHGRPDESLAEYEAVRAIKPLHKNANRWVAHHRLRRGEVDLALAVCSSAIARGLPDPWLLYQRGRCHELKGSKVAARQSYLAAVAAAPREATFKSALDRMIHSTSPRSIGPR